MRNDTGKALAALLVLVSVVAALEGILLLGLSGRVADLEKRADGELTGPGGDALGREVEELQERSSVQEYAQAAVKEDVAEAIRRIEALESAVAIAPARASGPAPGADPERMRAAIEEAVARKVDEKMGEAPPAGGGEWKPSLDELAKALDLTEDQVERAERIFDDAKHEVFELAGLRRDDGRTMLDEMVDAVRDPEDPEGAMKKWFMSLFTKKIPGRDEAYIAEIIRIRNRAEKSLSAVLRVEQSKKLSRTNLDYLGVKTKYDPFAEYLMDSAR